MKLYRISHKSLIDFYLEADNPLHLESKVEALLPGLEDYHVDEVLQNTAFLHFEP